jgi:RNA-directed DNA polymerase
LCHSEQQAREVQAKLARWLAPRGLAFNEDKTTVVPLSEGFNFLGFNVRRHRFKLLIKPSKPAVKRIRSRLAVEMRKLRGSNAKAVLAKIAPIVRGWAAYYRGVVSSDIFTSLDNYVWQLTYKWAKCSHPNKPKKWITNRYYGQFHPDRRDHWVFGDRNSGAYLPKFAWHKIIRHQMVQGKASPDDPTLTEYWAGRRRRNSPPLGNSTLRLLKAQAGRCPVCRDYLLGADREPHSPNEWEQWLAGTIKAMATQTMALDGAPGKPDDIRLIHTACQRGATQTGRPKHQPIPNAKGFA